MTELYGHIINVDGLIGGSKPNRQINGYTVNVRLEG